MAPSERKAFPMAEQRWGDVRRKIIIRGMGNILLPLRLFPQ